MIWKTDLRTWGLYGKEVFNINKAVACESCRRRSHSNTMNSIILSPNILNKKINKWFLYFAHLRQLRSDSQGGSIILDTQILDNQIVNGENNCHDPQTISLCPTFQKKYVSCLCSQTESVPSKERIFLKLCTQVSFYREIIFTSTIGVKMCVIAHYLRKMLFCA